MKLSLIIPCYNEEAALPFIYDELVKVSASLSSYEIEYLFINDGSKDGTLAKLKELAASDPRVHYYSFSRNFGKEAGMYAGFCNATGDYVAVMDADLQDPPSLLPQMLEILKSGEYDSVATRRVNREGEPPIRSFFARQFYKLINRISDADIVDGARDFRLMKRDMVDAIVQLDEYNRFSKGIFGWIGFRTYWLPYENVERVAGETKWSFWKLFRYAIDGIINFSQVPLSIASFGGVLLTFISFIAILFVIIRRIVWGDAVGGWASLVCIITFIGGIQLFCMGIIGQYLSKTYLETKKRPHFIISDTNDAHSTKIH
jgi:glycosyltransferase involved in cell wall biosynthesis